MILEGGISYNQNWDKNGNIYYTDENGQVVDFKVNPFVKLANKVKATATNIGDWINETNPNSEAYKQKVSAIAGLETLPLGLGSFATQGIAKGLTPYVGRKIAQNMAQGIGSGVAGGAIGGGAEAGLNDRNIAIGGLQGATVGGLLGGLGGYGLGNLAQRKALYNIHKNPTNERQVYKYFDDYIKGLDGDPEITPSEKYTVKDVTPFQKEFRYLRKARGGKQLFAERLNDIITDENSVPISFYHGTPNSGFEEFNPLSHFTKNKEYAAIYKNPSASSIQVKQTANNPAIYEVNLDINKMFDTRNPLEKNIFNNEYQAYYSPNLTERGLPDWMEAEDLAEWLQSKYPEYDALVVDEGATGGYGDIVKSRGESYIPFNPKQIKIRNVEYDR